jgi:hypothetical protein
MPSVPDRVPAPRRDDHSLDHLRRADSGPPRRGAWFVAPLLFTTGMCWPQWAANPSNTSGAPDHKGPEAVVLC